MLLLLYFCLFAAARFAWLSLHGIILVTSLAADLGRFLLVYFNGRLLRVFSHSFFSFPVVSLVCDRIQKFLHLHCVTFDICRDVSLADDGCLHFLLASLHFLSSVSSFAFVFWMKSIVSGEMIFHLAGKFFNIFPSARNLPSFLMAVFRPWARWRLSLLAVRIIIFHSGTFYGISLDTWRWAPLYLRFTNHIFKHFCPQELLLNCPKLARYRRFRS